METAKELFNSVVVLEIGLKSLGLVSESTAFLLGLVSVSDEEDSGFHFKTVFTPLPVPRRTAPPTPTSHHTPHVKAGDRRASCAVTVTTLGFATSQIPAPSVPLQGSQEAQLNNPGFKY
ncbi:uncharacterized [Tachysurus ichikawai]